MNPAVRVSNLSKVYKLYWGPRSLLREIFSGAKSHHEVWALKDINFEVENGETFGVIGPNGAGKSTLLKILTGTAYPSSGTVDIQARVSGLLELGAGFHPEFTGRENIYFNGALMGFNREEIRAREEAIIAFSELQEFIDRPVKTYSSGMYVRLGFSVATGFDPQILIVDEVLAVGDQSFQKKCTDLILSFKQNGRTIVFCSHNLYQVRTLCDRAIWLDRGILQSLGDAAEVVDRYTDSIREEGRQTSKDFRGPYSPAGINPAARDVCWIEKVQLATADGRPCDSFRTGDTFQLDVWARFSEHFPGTPGIGVSIVRNDGVVVYTSTNTIDGSKLLSVGENRYHGRIVYPHAPLLPGRYYFNVVTTDQHCLQAYDIVQQAEPFTISYSGTDFGIVQLNHFWEEPR
ncbi:MAG: ABC transporter ATP-binding protein [Acidobacteria bacterium]|nr:ABC transporter ATP-binding protein [Acidobacteriota bacterium]